MTNIPAAVVIEIIHVISNIIVYIAYDSSGETNLHLRNEAKKGEAVQVARYTRLQLIPESLPLNLRSTSLQTAQEIKR